jgi:hypothetical protein
MNCANHPERTATAFCQNCGKALCSECIRTSPFAPDGLILCEPCSVAWRGAQTAASSQAGSTAAAWSTVPPAAGSAFGGTHTGNAGAGSSAAGSAPPPYNAVPGSAPGYVPGSVPSGAFVPVPPPGAQPSSLLAGVLGFIPGVGAMYNGQFIKALLHVVIFIVLIGASEHFNLAGILIAAWVFYQVFDAAQTASARRDGRPLPDPFGILDMSRRLGPQGEIHAAYSYPPMTAQPMTAQPMTAQPMTAQPMTAPPMTAQPVPPPPIAPAPPVSGYPPTPLAPHAPMPPQRRSEPIGAIVLIVVGLLFLMSTLGVLDVDWIGRGWPVLLLLLGVWLLIRRASTPLPIPPLPAAPPSPPPSPGPYAAPDRHPLSITPPVGPDELRTVKVYEEVPKEDQQ